MQKKLFCKFSLLSNLLRFFFPINSYNLFNNNCLKHLLLFCLLRFLGFFRSFVRFLGFFRSFVSQINLCVRFFFIISPVSFKLRKPILL